jgi:DNA (cytosine-5)-methyltransferase 1
MRPRLLDLFCGEGGSATGYDMAGFEVVGVDKEPQPRYPFEFHQGDAMTWPLAGFDVVTGSPPCNDWSPLSAFRGKHGTGWMLPATLERFRASGLPYVVENVSAEALPGELSLCGSEFGLRARSRGEVWHLRRHRRFASNVFLMGAGGCTCSGLRIGGVYGHGGGTSAAGGFTLDLAGAREAMEMPWASRQGVSQAIPPAYTKFIGEQVMAQLMRSVR